MRNRLAILILLAIGFGFMLIGGLLAIFGSPAASSAARRAEQLQTVAASDLDQRAIGSEVLADGHISSRNQEQFHSFVAYVREEYRGNKPPSSSDRDDRDREQWDEDQRVTPPFLLELTSGPAQIANNDYALQSAPSHWQESDMLTWNGFTDEGTKRYYGFQADDPALVIGTIVDTNEGHALHADFVYGGNRAQYIASQRSSAVALFWIGTGFAVAGALVAAFGLWLAFKPGAKVAKRGR